MRRNVIIGIVSLSIIVLGIMLYLFIKSQNGNVKGKLRECPDSWIVNQMPTIVPESQQDLKPNLPNQYFILNEQRRELSEFDLDWVKKKCNLKPQVVQ